MRRVVDGLIVLLGLGGLLLLGFHDGPHPCSDHPWFTLQGTSVDCATRDSGESRIGRSVASVVSR
jgi:hypothetical protein